jgi:hypothetical protein
MMDNTSVAECGEGGEVKGRSFCVKKHKCIYFEARSQNCEERLLAASCLSVRLSVWKKGLGSRWKDFYEIWYLSIFRKSVEKIQVSLKSDTNNGYFT